MSEVEAPTKVSSHGGAPGVGLIDFAELAADVRVETIPFVAADGGRSRGILYSRGTEKTVVCISHPRGDMSRHYAIPVLLDAGIAAYSHQCRGLNNDIDCVHEELLLDLAAGYRFLKETRGFENIVLLGNSGGGSLACFYQEQAARAAADRLTTTPGGEPTLFATLDMPPADGIALLGVHPGEGRFMLEAIDPSVVDESDPLLADPELDMYNEENGFRLPPEPSKYTDEFLARYRAAQVARVRRLDVIAKTIIAERNRNRAITLSDDFDTLSASEKVVVSRKAVVGHYMIIYRTEANPAYVDPTINSWESTRVVGTFSGRRPDLLNYAPGGFSRCITPRAWLSSWSGLSSNAEIHETIKSITIPTLILSYTADTGCFPIHNKEEFDNSPAVDKEMVLINGDHFGVPLSSRVEALATLVDWIKKRF